MQISAFQIERLLTQVQKPARYIGGEWNSIAKDWDGIEISIALAYPDVYEIGMSNLGLAILYDLVNARPTMAAERVYAPWDDMECAMREAGIPLYSLDTQHALADFDVLGFTLQHELIYSNVLNMLDLADLPIKAKDRTPDMPLVIGGGSCTYNPEPLAPFFDLFVIGEGEEVTIELLEALLAAKRSGLSEDRRELLLRLAQIPGIYVPSLYDLHYRDDGTLDAIEPNHPDVPQRVLKRIVTELSPAPARPIVPNMGIVHDRAGVEIQRGCSRGCRFCQAGIIYRPIRERPVNEVLSAAQAIIRNTGYDEIGLVSLSSSDHSGISQIVQGLLDEHGEQGLAISLPSLRIDSFSVDLAQMIQQQRKTGFTFAPEAGSQRLRDVINKGVSEDDLIETAEAAFASGWNRLKLYFMLGLPTETEEDIAEMARLIREIDALGRRLRHRRVDVGVSAATFVPKPHTPFQWLPLAQREQVEAHQRLLLKATPSRKVRVTWSDWDTTWLEGLLSRGDRRMARVVEHAWRSGARFDAWHERFDVSLWQEAMAACGVEDRFYLERPRDREEVFPWDMIEVGVSRRFLWREYQRAMRADLSPDCRFDCHNCGILAAFETEREDLPEAAWGCP